MDWNSVFKTIKIVLLYPFSLLYGSIMVGRNIFYNKDLFKVQSTPVFSIGIGNITVGGTGKTPHVEYFVRQFMSYKKLATLSRGYGRKTKGFLPVTSTLGPQQVGDEPWQFFLKFKSDLSVFVGEKRASAAQQIHQLHPEINLLLMDDVYQHRAVKADYSILLCDYHQPFFEDYPFPSGRLREFRSAAQRADSIIVSKCPGDISEKKMHRFRTQLNQYAPNVPVAFSTFIYDEIKPVFALSPLPTKWLLVTGIANPNPLISHLKQEDRLIKHVEYPDHHDFSEEESLEIKHTFQHVFQPGLGLLVTEKDYARLNEKTLELWKELPLFYIPISVQFIEGEEFLLRNIQQSMDRRAKLSN
ncbi:MAG: tetraacyldisaccharide 4-kinase [Chitinophagaceae bacterium]|nr:tetraacyldisaccharide 4-kinase [Chitinophagaceae bacterium]